jgi:hypothetical protein
VSQTFRLSVGTYLAAIAAGTIAAAAYLTVYERRVVAVDKRLEPPEMRFVEWLRAANRHANTVDRTEQS